MKESAKIKIRDYEMNDREREININRLSKLDNSSQYQQKTASKMNYIKSRNRRFIEKPYTVDITQNRKPDNDLKVIDLTDDSKLFNMNQKEAILFPEVNEQYKPSDRILIDDVKVKSGLSRNYHYSKLNSTIIPNTAIRITKEVANAIECADPKELYGTNIEHTLPSIKNTIEVKSSLLAPVDQNQNISGRSQARISPQRSLIQNNICDLEKMLNSRIKSNLMKDSVSLLNNLYSSDIARVKKKMVEYREKKDNASPFNKIINRYKIDKIQNK